MWSVILFVHVVEWKNVTSKGKSTCFLRGLEVMEIELDY